MARQNKFNRHATLLVYLNDCQEGGATCFDQLGLAVRPQRGTALLFFPSFANGSPDARCGRALARGSRVGGRADGRWPMGRDPLSRPPVQPVCAHVAGQPACL